MKISGISILILAIFLVLIIAGFSACNNNLLMDSIEEIDSGGDPPSVEASSPTNDRTPTWTWTVENGVTGVRYQLESEEGQWTEHDDIVTEFEPDLPLSESAHTLYVQTKSTLGNWSDSGSATVLVDLRSPTSPIVTGPSTTNNPTPTWAWTIPAGTTGFRYQLNAQTPAGWTEVDAGTIDYTPAFGLAAGSYILYVQAVNTLGNWSPSGLRTVTIDLTAPDPPPVTGTSPTNNPNPTWTWSIPATATNIRYQLNSESSGGWTEVGDTSVISFTPASPLSVGTHTLYVQASNNLQNWSLSGSKAITIDLSAPTAPIVTGTAMTNDTTPTWSWNVPTGTTSFRYQLDSELPAGWTLIDTSITSYTPATPLIEAVYTLYV
ncbi:MAG TPA: hypothetical protein ENI15_01370, partial [Spirochaetes bacterium]|nr:hypothetical protein [Spirochaetota bacterium]